MKHNIVRLILIGCLLLTTFFIGGTVFAQDEDLPDPGITPDSPFYFFDKISKNIGMFFTFGDEAKAKKALRYAEERLAEARAMALKSKFREMTRAANDFNGFMVTVAERLEAAARNGTPDAISENISAVTYRIRTRLGEIKDKFPLQPEGDLVTVDKDTGEEVDITGEARAAIERARTATADTQVKALRILGSNRPQRALDICADVAERHLERIRTTANLVSENVSEELDYAARIAALEEELVALAEEKGIDVTAIVKRLAQSTSNRLETLVEVYASAPESARQGIGNAIENSVKKYENIVKRVRNTDISSAISINITQAQNIEENIRERLEIQISSQERAADETPVNASIQVRTESQLQNQEKLSISELAITANQTQQRQVMENQERNNKTGG